MSDTIQPVEAANTGDPQSTETAPETESNPVQSLIERIRAKYGSTPEGEGEADATQGTEAPASGEEGEPPAEAAKDEPKSEGEGEKAPEEKRVELAYARLKDQNKDLRNANVELTSRAEAAERKVKDAGEQLAKLKAAARANPLKFIQDFTETKLDEIIARGKRGEFDRPEVQLPPEVQEAMDFYKREKAERAAREAEARREKEMTTYLPRLRDYLEDHAEKYPTLAVVDESIHRRLLEDYFEAQDSGTPVSLPELMQEMEEVGTQQLKGILGNKKLIAKFASADPLVKSLLVELASELSKQTLPPQRAESRGTKAPGQAVPRAVATQTEVLSRTAVDEDSEDAERAESLRRWRQFRATGSL